MYYLYLYYICYNIYTAHVHACTVHINYAKEMQVYIISEVKPKVAIYIFIYAYHLSL